MRKHIIKKLEIELHTGSQQDAFKLQEHYAAYVHPQLEHTLDEVFSHVDTQGQFIILDRLEIDAGKISQALFETDFTHRVEDVLIARLQQEIENVFRRPSGSTRVQNQALNHVQFFLVSEIPTADSSHDWTGKRNSLHSAKDRTYASSGKYLSREKYSAQGADQDHNENLFAGLGHGQGHYTKREMQQNRVLAFLEYGVLPWWSEVIHADELNHDASPAWIRQIKTGSICCKKFSLPQMPASVSCDSSPTGLLESCSGTSMSTFLRTLTP